MVKNPVFYKQINSNGYNKMPKNPLHYRTRVFRHESNYVAPDFKAICSSMNTTLQLNSVQFAAPYSLKMGARDFQQAEQVFS